MQSANNRVRIINRPFYGGSGPVSYDEAASAHAIEAGHGLRPVRAGQRDRFNHNGEGIDVPYCRSRPVVLVFSYTLFTGPQLTEAAPAGAR